MNIAATPFLLFQDGHALEAMEFYTSIFPNGRIIRADRHRGDDPDIADLILLGEFEILDLRVRCTDSPSEHDFGFSPAMSFFIDLESRDELHRLAEILADEGIVFMPPDEYGFSDHFAWVQDRFGISWQLNLPST